MTSHQQWQQHASIKKVRNRINLVLVVILLSILGMNASAIVQLFKQIF